MKKLLSIALFSSISVLQANASEQLNNNVMLADLAIDTLVITIADNLLVLN